MKVFVCGGAACTNKLAVFETLNELAKGMAVTEIHHGGWRGVDSFAEEWAEAAGVTTVVHPAKFDTFPTRQRRKVRALAIFQDYKPDLLIMFPGRMWSKDMAQWAKGCGIPVVRLDKRGSQPPPPPSKPTEPLFVRRGEGKGVRYVEASDADAGPKFRRAKVGARVRYIAA
jgi:ABC-type sugar transport system substrate-binding protein